MKKLFTILAALIITLGLFAQAPLRMSYQAVIRNSSNNLVSSHIVGMKVSILQGDANGASVYAETQTITTNTNGLATIEIGGGTPVTGTFGSINWANGPYFIKTETDQTGGTNYTISGTSQLLSVPYALHAKTAESVSGGITETDPIYGAWNKSTGISITASQVSDFQSGVTNNASVLANTAKNSYPSADAAKLAAITGINTGDQDLSGKVDKITGKGLSTNDYTTAEQIKVSNLSGTNTGDQDLSGKVDKVTGKGLSTNDYTTAEQTKVSNLSGTNTGDNATNSQYSGLVTNATHTGEVTGSNALTIDNAAVIGKVLTGYTSGAGIIVATDNILQAIQKLNGNDGGSNATHTGDATGATALTLTTVNSNVGTFNNVTINAKGLATAASNVAYLTSETDPTVKAITGIVKSNGTTISAATAGTDYLTPSGSGASLTGITSTQVGAPSGSGSSTGTNTGDDATNAQYSGLVTNATHTGDATGSGVLTIANNAVTDAKFRQGSARSIVGVTGNATANTSDIQGAADQILRVNGAGTALAFGAVDLSKSAAVGTSILPVANGGMGADVSPAGAGEVLYSSSATTYGHLVAGASGKVLTSGGAGAPTWETPSASSGWSLTGNASTVDGTNFIGTTGDVPFNVRVNNGKAGRIDNTLFNTFWGYQAGNSITTGTNNTANGASSLYSNTTANQNIAIGSSALYTQSFNNGDVSWNSDNVAVGYSALYLNQPTSTTDGVQNTAIGNLSLYSNTTGRNNTALGYQTLWSNTIGTDNTANGVAALISNTEGNYNTANGEAALYSNDIGTDNTAIGYQALYSNTSGSYNTANGESALSSNTTGSYNTAIGYGADVDESVSPLENATAIGANAVVAASNSLVLGETGVTNVGIGTTMPSATLEVDGGSGTTIKIVDSNEGTLGSVLTNVNGDGQGSWQAPASSVGGSGTANYLPKWESATSLSSTSNVYDDGTNVGIGTATPEFKLSIANDGGIIAKGVINSGTVLSTSGAGTRMLWYPRKAAFRAGYVDDAQWNDANVGVLSTAIGYSTTASGLYSTAMGYSTIASEQSSTAMGVSTTASGNTSTAMGASTTASGNTSTAMGYHTTASGYTSTAMGNNTTASGHTSTAMGYFTTASGDYSTSMGKYTTAPSYGETVIGLYNTVYLPASATSWNAADRLFVVGNGTGNGGTPNTNAMTILKSGNVGIGTALPSAFLDINPIVTETADVKNFQSGMEYNGVSAMANWFGSYIATPTGIGTITNKYALVTEASAGNVGIGTTAPTSMFSVGSSNEFQVNSIGNIIKINNVTSSFPSSQGAASTVLQNDGSGNLSWAAPTAVREVVDEFTATASQTAFTLTQTPSANSKVKMYVNGIRISNTAYSKTGTALTYVPANNGGYALLLNDRIQMDYYY